MTEKKSLREVFETNEQAKKVESVWTGKKVVAFVSFIGMAASILMLGFGVWYRDSSKITIFGLLTLFCAATFFASVKEKKSEK